MKNDPLSEKIQQQSSQLGLRTRISLSFAVGGFLVSVALAGVTLVLTRQHLIDSKERDAAAFAVTNATRLSNQLTFESTIEDLGPIVDSMTKIEGSQRLIRLGDDWLPAPELGREDLPANLIQRVSLKKPSQIRATVDGETQLVVGIPLQSFNASYYAVVTLGDLDETLANLQIILMGAGAGTTLLAALLGWWASQRTLLPLRRVRGAAEAIAGGRLDTRLDPQSDPDLDRLAESFNEMAKALEERIQRDARFASEVSHELRSPLTTLKASVGVLQARKDELSERSLTALELLSRDLDRFNRLVAELLEISGYDAGVASLELSEVQIASFLEAAVRNFGPVPIHIPEEAEHLIIEVDKRRLARVMSNLLDNAGRYGGGPETILVEYFENTLRIIVEDSGPGVAETERTAIFDRFSRGASGGQRGDDSGTGLGLSLVQEDIRLHGGRVWVEDRVSNQKGARFVLEIPIEYSK